MDISLKQFYKQLLFSGKSPEKPTTISERDSLCVYGRRRKDPPKKKCSFHSAVHWRVVYARDDSPFSFESAAMAA